MSMPNPLIQRYLSEFRSGLRRLGDREQSELCMEIESHIHEAMNAGQSLAEVLDRLGPADRLARAYSAELLLTAPARGGGKVVRFFALAGILAGTSLSSLIVIPTLFGMSLGFGLGGAITVVGGMLTLAFPGFMTVPTGFWLPLPLASAAVILLGVCLAAVGWGAFTLLRNYFHFLTITLRRTFAE